MQAEPELVYRYLIRPEKVLMAEYEILEFSNKMTDKIVELGRLGAEKAVEEGAGVEFKRVYDRAVMKTGH